MNELNHNTIDILKMDIEGAEYKLLDNIIESDIKIHQLLIEFHHRFHSNGISLTRETIPKLRIRGYVLFHVSRSGEEFSFLNLNYPK